jgi:hypothetical protein
MATLDWHVTEEGGVTLVSLVVESETAERVRVTNCLDGPVWPPRRQGVPEEGWDEEGYEGTVEAGGRLLLGYASPADPADPPARVRSLGPADDASAATAREVVRTLGDPSPPRDAVSPGDTPAAGGAGAAGTTLRRAGDDAPAEPSDPGNGSSASGPDGPGGYSGERERNGASHRTEGTGGRQAAPDQYAAVEAWLDAVADRLEDAERLARVSSVPEASEAVASAGGPDDIARLRASLQEDRDRLKRVAGQCEDLAARAGDIEVPVETLERLA